MFYFCSMDAPAHITERTQQMLGELAELSMTLARDLHACALSAESAAEKAQMAAAFHKAARSVRQSLALHARMARDDRREAAEAAHAEREARKARVQARKAQVSGIVERLIWDEAEDAEAETALEAELEDHLDALAETEAFLESPLGLLIARLCEALGITPPAHLALATCDPAPPALAPDSS